MPDLPQQVGLQRIALSPLPQQAIVTANDWAFTLTDGARRID